MDIAKNYNPQQTEDKIFEKWQQAGCFNHSIDEDKKPFSIVIPPPNVTGVLHMGHALNNTIQDILVRKAALDGLNVRWVVGTDHAGIATQNVVERKLHKEGKNRHDLGREKFLQEVWQWKDDHGSTIINQLKKIGCNCDFERERFTMDDGLAFAVKKCFVELFKKDLIYRGDRMIHWCCRCHTALSDEEAEHHDNDNGKLYTFRYPLADSTGYITIATTRPETLLGDTAVAVNPDDERFADLIGKNVIVPFVDREIAIIKDNYVDKEFGSGMVKITPAHDPNDYEIGHRHSLPVITVMDDNGIMNENAGPYKGQDRFECRKNIINDLKEQGLLVDIKDHEMSIRKCYRCSTIVEPKISKQWFVRMKPLADKALKELEKGQPEFHPQRFENIYRRWLEGIRDWCISRQIWWGHQIPAWYCDKCEHINVTESEAPESCEQCNSTSLTRETDVLDTWFSSWLWPFSTLGWPEKTKDISHFFPTNTLVTAQEIIFFWVARMVMSSLEFLEKIPFEKVYIHGTVRDEKGMKMSKSLGNVIDPLLIINKYGADALRFSLMIIASRGNDIYLSDKKFEIGRNFATKIWNACRFLLMNMEEIKINKDSYKNYESSFSNDDKLIIYKLHEMSADVDQYIKDFRFNDAALSLYDFFWKHFCDRYIEAVKPYLREEGADKERSISILFYVLTDFFTCLSPFMPFLSEELWQILKSFDNTLSDLVVNSSWPENSKLEKLPNDLIYTGEKYELAREGRHLRKSFSIPPKAQVNFFIKTDSEKISFLEQEKDSLKRLLNASAVNMSIDSTVSSPMPSSLTSLGTIFMELDKDLIDHQKEAIKIKKQLTSVEEALSKVNKKLSNEKFLQNAKALIIEKEKEKAAAFQDELNKLNETLLFFKEG